MLSLAASHACNRFLAEAVYDLRNTLRSKNSDLLVRFGKMEKIVEQVVDALKENGDKVKSVYLQKDVSGVGSSRHYLKD